MFLYIPYGTDAPVYCRPMVTVAMIVVNVLVFMIFAAEHIEPYRLAMGDGLHPLQWFTTNFLHADIFHLLFNMLFLWVFGLVVEGKLGSLRMLGLYLGLCVLFGAVVQLLTLGCEPNFRLGSSGVIFALAAMSFIWVPESKVHAITIYWFLYRFGIKEHETPISLVVGFFAVLLVGWSCFFGSGLIGELGHLVGAVLGLVTAMVMLKTGLVDCEHLDIFSIWSGRDLLSDEDRAALEENKPANIKRRAKEEQKRQHLLDEEIELALHNQTPLPAFVIAQRKERDFPDWTLPQALHMKIIQQLLGGNHWTEATTSMRQYLERHQEQSVFVHLMLAQALLSQNKPEAAIEVLHDIPQQNMATEQQSIVKKIQQRAEAMQRKNQEEGYYELEDT